MTTESRADFARRMGWNRSSVTRAVRDGRVVLAGDLVDVEASLAKIDALASPYAHHRAHAQQLEEARHAKAPTDAAVEAALKAYAPLPDAAPVEGLEALNLRLKRAEADKREHEADIARMEREKIACNLIAREDVEFTLAEFGATLRSLMENLADRLAPVVHPLQSIEETHAAIAEAATDVLLTIYHQMRTKANEHVSEKLLRDSEYLQPSDDRPREKAKRRVSSGAHFAGTLTENTRAGHRYLSDETE